MKRTTPVTPTVGMGATLRLWTDCHACTIIAVSKSGKQITLQRDKAKLLNGVDSGEKDALQFEPGGFVGHTSGQQRYSYEPDPEGEIVKASFRGTVESTEWDPKAKKHVKVTLPIWKVVNHRTNSPGMSVRLDVRDEHFDFNF